jgi:RND family efflux transporter MFP subunit
MLNKINSLKKAHFAYLLVLLLVACGSEIVEEASAPVVRPVKLITVESASNVQIRTFPAVIDVIESSELAFQVGGLIEQFPVIEAQEVEEGELLAQLDQRDYVNQLTTARAQFTIAETEYKRAQRLAEEDAIAQSVLEQRESQFNIASAALDSAEKALADTVLAAPYAGTIATKFASSLDNVQPGQVVVSIIGNGAMQANVAIPANLVVNAPDPEGQNNAFVTLDAAPDYRIPALFRDANLSADTTSQTFEAGFSFMPPADLNILPGMNASVILEVPSSSLSVGDASASIPLAAILSEGDGQYVWLVNSDSMQVSKIKVIVAEGVGETVNIVSGLQPGDVIVGAGASYLSEGMKIRPWEI